MRYRQVTSHQRYMLAELRKQQFSRAQMARALGCHRSTISRELARNTCRYDGCYRPQKASERTKGRRARSRRGRRFTDQQWRFVESLLALQWSPEQIAGRLKAMGKLSISYETIYRHVWRDKAQGGRLHTQLRGARKLKRKRYGAYDSRGRLAGKRHISERPEPANARSEPGHWEIDTVLGNDPGKDCIVTLNERRSGAVLIGKLPRKTTATMNRVAINLIKRRGLPFKTITADNGTEFHGYAEIEAASDVRFYFANPYHSWERGSNENLNGLIRQYLPKRRSMWYVTQGLCDAIADRLNTRPRKRFGFQTPWERLYEN
ncbi:IS30 family transposase [Alkalilimnicola sp. S0819]|uniref:IS30 family transposase n=1 Tax=Alkalilimnicola sp. S0819 TaxID=2613922 RepID=UPI001261685E|nr:IS30 family transposase [Alkalilimnicola sp. S0819]KAB7619420.1 IS30 family transposase [Alkalilimnicola sp. S0819]MPQ17714.1 IS30 family transposase [Alkalilimnicola sp. S0819]